MNRLQSAAEAFHARHERLKNFVHTAWRYPLPRWGRVCMGFVYFSIPVVGGYAVMQWAIGKSHESIGEKGEKLRLKEVEGLGNTAIIGGEQHRVGAGGVGMGVHLANSDKVDQERNRMMLEKFFERERRKRLKLARETEDEKEASKTSL